MSGKTPGLRQRSPGTWEITVSTGRRGPDGKYGRVVETYKGTKKHAEHRRAELITQIKSGEYLKPSRETVAGFLLRWLDAQAALSAGSQLRYRRTIEMHVVPHVGSLQLSTVDAGDILRLHAAWRAAGLSVSTQSLNHSIVHHAFSQARSWRLIRYNPVDDVKPPSGKERREREVIAPGELRALMRELDALDETRILFRLLVHTGMREGEALGLRWRDVDLSTGTATIAQQRTTRRTFEPTKSYRSDRGVALDAELVAMLRLHKAEQNEVRLRTRGWQANDLVCCREDGAPLTHRLTYTHFKKALERAGLPGHVRPHDLRHVHASYLLAQGTDLKVVQERLGHSSPAFTLTHYAHQVPGFQRQAADRFAASLNDGPLSQDVPEVR